MTVKIKKITIFDLKLNFFFFFCKVINVYELYWFVIDIYDAITKLPD